MKETGIKFRNETIRGYDVHVYSGALGEKPAVILVHGVGVSHEYYEPFMKFLGKNFAVIALDLPGFGTTKDPKQTLSVDELAEIVATFVNKHKLEKCILLGHSMGAQVVTAAASMHPDICQQLVLLAPTIYDRERTVKQQMHRLWQDVWREPFTLRMVALWDYLWAGPDRMMRTLRSMLVDDIEDDIAEVAVPVLVVQGSRDPVVPKAWAEKLTRKAQQGTFKQIVGGAHAFHYSHAEQTAQVCTAFLEMQ